MKKDIKGIIFDYGGTIDTNSRHWAEVLWEKYREVEVPVSKEEFREAYVFGERSLAKYPFVRTDHDFHEVLRIKCKLQMEYLAEKRFLPMVEADLQRYATQVADACYNYVLGVLERTRPVVEALSKKYRLVLVSNFYGNIQTILEDFGLDGFFEEVVESSVVGVRKPDPAIYRTCLRRLGIAPEECLYVGDGGSFELETARSLGLQAVQATWYRQAAFEHKQAALRPDFPQLSDPMEVLDWVTK